MPGVTLYGPGGDSAGLLYKQLIDLADALATETASKLAIASNLADLASAPTARTNLGLGTAATANKVAAGSAGVLDATDPTTTNARTPTDGSVTTAKIAAALIDGTTSTPSLRTLGTGAQQAAPGNVLAVSNPYQAMETAFLTRLLANTHTASGNFAFEWISPGAGYLSGQWLWDSCFEAVVAASLGQGTRAQNWLKNWITIQNGGTGMLPNSATPTTTNFNNSQPPVLAWATHQVYLHTADSAFLAAMYPVLKLFYGWWEANRMDSNGLFSWGSSQVGANQNVREANARYESGQDGYLLYIDNQFGNVTTAPDTADYICVDLCSLLVVEADSISKIATILGNSADATTYAAKRDAVKTAMNSILWDDEQGCYQAAARADQGVALGDTGGSQANAGATSVTLASALTIPLLQGQRLLFGNGVKAQVGSGGAAVGATSVPLQVGLSGAVPGTTAVTMLRLVYCKTLATTALPLWANVPTTAQARRIHDEHLMKTYSGTELATFTTYLGSGYGAKNRLHKYLHFAWRLGPLAAVGGQLIVNADSLEQITGAGQLQMFQISYRNSANSNERAYSDLRTDEAKTSPSRPLTITVYFVQPASGNNKPQVTMTNYPANTTVLNSVISSGAGVGVATSGSASYAGTTRPYNVSLLQQSGNNANLKVQAVQIDLYPIGSPFLSGHGLIWAPRFSDYSIAKEENAAANDVMDYWRGDHWVNLEYLAIQGLLNYGMGQSARQVARSVVERVHSEWVRTGQFWERYGMRGNGKGSVDYGWTGLACMLARQFGLPGGDAQAVP